jgi:hypothetical protein
MGVFNTHGSKAIGIVLTLTLYAQAIATMSAANKNRPPTPQDSVEMGMAVVMFGLATVVLYKTFMAL